MKASIPNSVFACSYKLSLYLSISCVFLLFSCGTKLQSANHSLQKETEQNQALNSTSSSTSDHKIIFLNYSISKKENSDKKVELISKIIAEGKIKKNSNRFITKTRVGDLQCIQMNDSNMPIKSIFIKNPLSKTIEYVNASDNLEKRQIETNTTPFSIRLQLEPQTTSVVIKEVMTPDEKMNTLLTTKVY